MRAIRQRETLFVHFALARRKQCIAFHCMTIRRDPASCVQSEMKLREQKNTSTDLHALDWMLNLEFTRVSARAFPNLRSACGLYAINTF